MTNQPHTNNVIVLANNQLWRYYISHRWTDEQKLIKLRDELRNEYGKGAREDGSKEG